MPVALLAVVGALITFFALWPLWGGLIALAAAPFGGSLLAVLVVTLATLRPHAQKRLDRYRDERGADQDRSAASKASR